MIHIDRIEIYRVGLPLVYPFRTAFGNDDRIESILVCLRSGHLYGWGEATPWQSPGYSSECAATAFMIVRDFLAPRLLGKRIGSGEELQALLAPVKGNHFAKASLDLAWWDAHAKQEEKPLYQVLGGDRTHIDVGADFGIMESIDALLETMAQAQADGFKRVKLKYRPGWELDMIAAVRSTFPTLPVHVDCNSAYTLEDSVMLHALDQYNLTMIEQPLAHDDLIDHATLQKRIRTPICLDESITSVAKARKAIEIGAAGWINIKPGRVGGLTPARHIHDLCRQHSIPCWVGGMLESAIGAHHCMALATLDNFLYPNDIFPTHRFYEQDLSLQPVELSGPSQMQLPNIPGCGVEPDPARLKMATMQSALIE